MISKIILFLNCGNGLDKSGGKVHALDSAEYSGSLIMLLNEGVGFVKRNMKMRRIIERKFKNNTVRDTETIKSFQK